MKYTSTIAFLVGLCLAVECWPQTPVGTYQFDDTILTVSVISGYPCVISEGQIRGLRQAETPDNFEYGNALASFDSIEGSLEFRDKKVHWIAGEIVRTGTRVLFEEKEISFANAKLNLAGSIILPRGSGPFPFVVFTHGSGEETREESRALAYYFALHGIGGLIYDKRGTGKSGGKDWQDTFDNYANDAIAAAEFLSGQAFVKRNMVGIYGHSQGGWIVPLALSKTAIFSFGIMSAANAVSPVEQTLDAGDEELKLLGMDESTIKEVRAFRKLKYDVGVGGGDVRHYERRMLPEAEKKPWFKYTGGRLPGGTFWKANGFYDPRPALERIKCPVLMVYGEFDISTNTARNLPLMTNYLAGHDAEFMSFPANHWMMEVNSKNSTKAQALRIKKFPDGYPDALVEWTKRKTVDK